MAKKKNKDQSKKKTKNAAETSAAATTSGPETEGPPMPTFKHVAKRKLSTGKGATAAEIGRSLVDLFNGGKAEEVERLWHHKKIESIEGDGSVFLGRKGIAEKNDWWYSNFEVHSARADGPFVGATGFSVLFTMECTPKGGSRISSREIGVYTVEKGKIVREEFMGQCSG